MSNPFKFTGLTYDDIMAQVNRLIESDPRFANFRESDVAKFIVEMFAGTTDIVNYYLQRRAEECYFDSAQHRSSVISLSRMFGYDVKRKIPAKSTITMKLAGDLSQLVSEGDIIQIPYFVSFSYSGFPFVLENTFTYTISKAVAARIVAEGEQFSIDISVDDYGAPLKVLQGEIKEVVIEGTNNNQLGATYQKYKVEDFDFSNLYGVDDWTYNKVCRVFIGQNKTDSNRFDIDRKSLINWETISQSTTIEGGAKVCLIRTTPDENVEIMFGNGGYNGFASLGAVNVEDNVFIQYLATKGSEANMPGVIGKKLTYSGKVYTTGGVDLSNKTSFTFVSNVLYGSDMETLESIKYAAPKIYYSLDRLVSKDDYAAYLKSLTYPIDIKNAFAWGEQEQKPDRQFADVKSYNAAFFTCTGSLYNLPANGIYSVKSGDAINSAVLDDNYSEDKINNQSIYNVYTRQALAKQIKTYQTLDDVYNRVYNLRVDGYDTSAVYIEQFKNNVAMENTNIVFNYTADDYMYGSDIITSGQVSADFRSVNSITEVATKLQTALRSVIDMRGDDLGIRNANRGSVAFPYVTCDAWWGDVINPNSFNMKISFPMNHTNVDNYCYIKEFVNSASALLNHIGITSANYSNTVEKIRRVVEEPISDKIVSVVNNLSTRSQITIQNIYIAPLIHSYQLVGNVYVKPLYDKDTIKTQVNNAIYSWLDVNADFNAVIYHSNIVQIIEDNSAISHTNFDIVPYPNTGTTNYSVMRDNFYAYKNVDNIQKILSSAFDPYFNIETTNPLFESITEDWFYNTKLVDVTTQINAYLMSGNATSADFVFVYVPSVSINGIQYDIISKDGLSGFIANTKMIPDYSKSFLNALDNIRAGLTWAIKKNLLDSGNISKYTVGSEIVKIDCSPLKYVYI